MAARRLSRLQRQILRCLLTQAQRTPGVIGMGHRALVQTLRQDNPTTTSALDLLIFLAYFASKHSAPSPSGGQRCYRKVARQTRRSPSHDLSSPPAMSKDFWMNSRLSMTTSAPVLLVASPAGT